MQSAHAIGKKQHNDICLHGGDGLGMRSLHRQLRGAVGDGSPHMVNARSPAIFSVLAFCQLLSIMSVK